VIRCGPQALISIYKFRTTFGEARYTLAPTQQPKALRDGFVLAFGQIRVETRIDFHLNWLILNATNPKGSGQKRRELQDLRDKAKPLALFNLSTVTVE
jgi:hypothetical protein